MTQIDKKNRNELVQKALNNTVLNKQIEAYHSGDEKKIARFKSAIQTISFDPNLLGCTPLSIVKAALSGAEVGLSPLKQLGHMYFVPYKNNSDKKNPVTEAQAQIGYKGWRTLISRSGKTVKTHRIYACDKFHFSISGFDESFEYIPSFQEHKESDRKWVIENIKGILVLVKDHNTKEVHQTFVTKDKLFQIKGMSPAIKFNKKSAWNDWEAEMLTAKAMKYVLSKLPMDDDLARAVEIDNNVDIENAVETSSRKEKEADYYGQQYAKDEPIDVESQDVPEDQKPENQTQEEPF